MPCMPTFPTSGAILILLLVFLSHSSWCRLYFSWAGLRRSTVSVRLSLVCVINILLFFSPRCYSSRGAYDHTKAPLYWYVELPFCLWCPTDWLMSSSFRYWCASCVAFRAFQHLLLACRSLRNPHPRTCQFDRARNRKWICDRTGCSLKSYLFFTCTDRPLE